MKSLLSKLLTLPSADEKNSFSTYRLYTNDALSSILFQPITARLFPTAAPFPALFIRAPRFSTFLVFCDVFYAVFCADSENVLKNVIQLTSGKIWEGGDPPLFQNLVRSLNSVFISKVIMILRVILFERAFNSVQLKKNCCINSIS